MPAAETFKEAIAQAQEHLRCGRSAEAEAVCRRVLTREPGHPAALDVMGLVLARRGEFAAARDSFDRAIALDPDVAEFHLHRGRTLFHLGDCVAAAEACARAIALRPDASEAHYHLGQARHEMRQWDAAAASYRQALTLNPRHARAQHQLGLVLKHLG